MFSNDLPLLDFCEFSSRGDEVAPVYIGLQVVLSWFRNASSIVLFLLAASMSVLKLVTTGVKICQKVNVAKKEIYV